MLIYANVVGNLTFLVKTEIYYYFLGINISMYQKVLRAQVCVGVHVGMHVCMHACVCACTCAYEGITNFNAKSCWIIIGLN